MSVRIALLGCGVVGSAVAKRLIEHSDELTERVGDRLELVGVAVRDVSKPRPESGVPAELFTDDSEELVTRADVVVELMGGIEPARTLLLKAIEHGASVVTANKALLGEDGPSLYAAAAEANVDFSFEAAVAGAIPLIRPLRISLAGDDVHRVMGIVNGTTNFILDKMDRTGADFADVLAEAQELGYAEADPTADVEGYDARAKAAILASLAFHTRVSSAEVYCEGITAITADDIRAARKAGLVIKLLAICERVTDEEGSAAISARVHPALLPRSHPLASVREAFNAVFVETQLAGELMFYGRGAGGEPTASAVLGDLVQAARNRLVGRAGPGELAYAAFPIQTIGAAYTAYFIRLRVKDRPGVLAAVSNVFAAQGVSIESMRQNKDRSDPELASLHLVTHRAQEGALAGTVKQLQDLDEVDSVDSVMRVEGL